MRKRRMSISRGKMLVINLKKHKVNADPPKFLQVNPNKRSTIDTKVTWWHVDQCMSGASQLPT